MDRDGHWVNFAGELVERKPGERDFKPVEWLPLFILDADSIGHDFDVINPPNHLVPFSRFEWLKERPAVCCVLPPTDSLALDDRSEILELLSQVPPDDRSERAQTARLQLWALLVEFDLNARLLEFPDWNALLDHVTSARAAYLKRIDAGDVPSLSEVQSTAADAPGVFAHFGNSLPTREMIELLAPLAPILELGAGFGLAARALTQCGVKVVAVDPEPQNAGFAFPMVKKPAAGVTLNLKGAPASVLIMWPDFKDDWFLKVFERATGGQIIAFASPEMDHLLEGPVYGERLVRENWPCGRALERLLRRDFTEIGRAPCLGTGCGSHPTWLRLLRRN